MADRVNFTLNFTLPKLLPRHSPIYTTPVFPPSSKPMSKPMENKSISRQSTPIPHPRYHLPPNLNPSSPHHLENMRIQTPLSRFKCSRVQKNQTPPRPQHIQTTPRLRHDGVQPNKIFTYRTINLPHSSSPSQ